jgi:flagellar M-ring protein FliF
MLIGPGGTIVTTTTATTLPNGTLPAVTGSVPGTSGVNVAGPAGGSITTAGGPNVAIVGSDAQVAISNRTSAMIDVAKVQGQVHAQSVQKVGELADKNPNEAVAIVRSWLHENAA